MYNTNTFRQPFFENFSNYIALAPEFATKVMESITSMTKTEFRLLGLFLKLAHDIKTMVIAQDTLANYLKVSRETINRLITKLENWGLIDSRGHLYDVRKYRVNSWFLNPQVRLMLYKLFPALALNIQSFKNKNVTPYKNNLYIYKFNNLTTSNRLTTKKRREIMKPINEVFGQDEPDPKDYAELYHTTNPRKRTNYSHQTNQRPEDQEIPKRGNSNYTSSDVNAHYAKKIEETKQLVESYKPTTITFQQAMEEITKLEKHAEDPGMDAFKRLMGMDGFNKWLRSQCDRILARVDFDKKD